MMQLHCDRCKKVVIVSDYGITDNGCFIEFVGGYGDFNDTIVDGPYEVMICHECGHELADWLGINVNNWHTHVPPELGGTQHADHHE